MMYKKNLLVILLLFYAFGLQAHGSLKSIRNFQVLPTNNAATNARNLQKAIRLSPGKKPGLYQASTLVQAKKRFRRK